MNLPLSGKNNNFIVLIDDEDCKKIEPFRWWINKRHNRAYTQFWDKIEKRPKTIYLSRFVMNAPENVVVDHINKNTLDNRKCNLRFGTVQQNSYNMKKKVSNVSGFVGVDYHENKKWRATIRINGRKKHLGLFDTPQEASKAYLTMAKKTRGSWFPNE